MTASLETRAQALTELISGKYNKESAMQYLQENSQEVDFLSIAVLVIDVGQSVEVPGVDIRGGELSVPQDTIIKTRDPLTVEQLASSEFGGGGNVTLPAAALGIKTGIMGYVGEDVEGKYFIEGMRKHGINTHGIIKDALFRTDVCIKLQLKHPKGEREPREPLVFCEHAGKYFDFGNLAVKERLIALNPASVQISYSGLFEYGADLENGQRLAEGIKWIKKTLDALVMVDTHTYKKDPQRYDCLKPSLEFANMFVCSDDEVELIVPQYKIPSGETKEEKRQSFLHFLRDTYCKGDEARLYAVTSPEESVVLYYKPGGEAVEVKVENWFTTTQDIFTPTGAGDSWRAGLNAYILHHQEEFKSGNLNIEEAVQFANLTARLYISGSGTTAFRHNNRHYEYQHLLDLVSQPRPKADLKPLTAVYEVLDGAA